jgi:hypothetical protein
VLKPFPYKITLRSRHSSTAKEASSPNLPVPVLLVFIQELYVSLVYGPIAAYLIEAFPAKVRYTSLSLRYHIGNGVFGGLLPLMGLSMRCSTGNIYAGLCYPMIVATLTFVIGSMLLKKPMAAGYRTKLVAKRSPPTKLDWLGRERPSAVVPSHPCTWPLSQRLSDCQLRTCFPTSTFVR